MNAYSPFAVVFFYPFHYAETCHGIFDTPTFPSKSAVQTFVIKVQGRITLLDCKAPTVDLCNDAYTHLHLAMFQKTSLPFRNARETAKQKQDCNGATKVNKERGCKAVMSYLKQERKIPLKDTDQAFPLKAGK